MESIQIYEENEIIYIFNPKTGKWHEAYEEIAYGMNVYEIEDTPAENINPISEIKNLHGYIWKEDTKLIIEKKSIPVVFN